MVVLRLRRVLNEDKALGARRDIYALSVDGYLFLLSTAQVAGLPVGGGDVHDIGFAFHKRDHGLVGAFLCDDQVNLSDVGAHPFDILVQLQLLLLKPKHMRHYSQAELLAGLLELLALLVVQFPLQLSLLAGLFQFLVQKLFQALIACDFHVTLQSHFKLGLL